MSIGVLDLTAGAIFIGEAQSCAAAFEELILFQRFDSVLAKPLRLVEKSCDEGLGEDHVTKSNR